MVEAIWMSSSPMPGLATTYVSPVSITLDSHRGSLLRIAGQAPAPPVRHTRHLSAAAMSWLFFALTKRVAGALLPLAKVYKCPSAGCLPCYLRDAFACLLSQ